MKRIPTTQFKNKSPAQWLNGWEFFTTFANEVNIFKDGFFMILNDKRNLVIYDIDGVAARLTLSHSLIRKMLQAEETLCAMQRELNEREENSKNYLNGLPV